MYRYRIDPTLRKGLLCYLFLMLGCWVAHATTDLSQPWTLGPNYNKNQLYCDLKMNVRAGEFLIGYVILSNGTIVAEDYKDPSSRDGLYTAFSATKTWSSMIVGLLVDNGQLDLSSSLGDIFDDDAVWVDIVDAEEKQTLTMQEVLTMTSGLSERFEIQESLAAQTSLLDVLNATAFNATQRGTYEYLQTNHILAHVIHQASGGKSPLELAAEAGLFEALGLVADVDYTWDTFGEVEGSAVGLSLNPRSLAKLGQLYLQEGLAAPDLSMISPQWVALSTSNQLPPGEVPDNADQLYRGYGYQWYTDIDGDDASDGSSFAAIGGGGQLMVVFPREKIVVSIMTSFDGQASVLLATIESFRLFSIVRNGLEVIDQDGTCVDEEVEETEEPSAAPVKETTEPSTAPVEETTEQSTAPTVTTTLVILVLLSIYVATTL